MPPLLSVRVYLVNVQLSKVIDSSVRSKDTIHGAQTFFTEYLDTRVHRYLFQSQRMKTCLFRKIYIIL